MLRGQHLVYGRQFFFSIKFFFILFLSNINSALAECILIEPKTEKVFKIYNALLYEDMPTLNELCIEPINVMYSWHFFPKGPKKYPNKLPSNMSYRHAVDLIQKRGMLTVIDIEHWPLRGVPDQVAIRSSKKYFEVLRRLKSEIPNTRIGYYGVVPVTDFYRARQPFVDQRYESWQRDNDRLKGVAETVDAIFPSLYTITPNIDHWIARAKGKLAETRRLAPGKPVYPFIWPNYHPQGGRFPVGKEVEGKYWKAQLEFLRDNADGVVLWGGNKQRFNVKSMWWLETIQFLDSFSKKSGMDDGPELE